MDQAITIDKKAFLAHINDVCGRVVVDSYYKNHSDGRCELILVYSDGAEKPFKGLRQAA